MITIIPIALACLVVGFFIVGFEFGCRYGAKKTVERIEQVFTKDGVRLYKTQNRKQ